MSPDRSHDIDAFIEHARSKGMDHATIRMLLLSTGWKEKAIVEALAKTSLEMPIPAPPDSGNARDAVLQLLATMTLYAAVVAAIAVISVGIERLLPDLGAIQDEWRVDYQRSSLRWSLAWLLVTFPLFLWTGRVVQRRFEAQPERAFSGPRRWLGNLTLLVTAITIAVDLIVLLVELMEGEIELRFILQVLVVLLFAGLMFLYHLLALRRSPIAPEARRLRRVFLGVALGFAVATTCWGFGMLGSPASARERRLDQIRLDHLQSIRRELSLHHLRSRDPRETGSAPGRPLPASLEELRDLTLDRALIIHDPQSGQPYGYEVLGAHRFRIGADFARPAPATTEPRWRHPAGPSWFEFDLDRDP